MKAGSPIPEGMMKLQCFAEVPARDSKPALSAETELLVC